MIAHHDPIAIVKGSSVFFGVQAAVVRCCEDVHPAAVQDSCWLCVFWDELSGTLHGDYPAKNVWPKSKCDLRGQLPRSTCTILWWWNCKRQVCQCWHQCWISLMAFLDNWNQLDVRLKACHQSEIAWRAFKGSEKKTAQLRPLAIFLTDWDSSLSSQNKSSHRIWRVFVNLLSGATGPACCAVAEGKKNQFASPICCCFQIHLAATVLMRPRVLVGNRQSRCTLLVLLSGPRTGAAVAAVWGTLSTHVGHVGGNFLILTFALGSLEVWQWEFLQAGLVNYLVTCDSGTREQDRWLVIPKEPNAPFAFVWYAWNVFLSEDPLLSTDRLPRSLSLGTWYIIWGGEELLELQRNIWASGCPSFRHVRRTLRKGWDGTLICKGRCCLILSLDNISR